MLKIPMQIEFDDLLELIEQLSPEKKLLLREKLDAAAVDEPDERIPGLYRGMIWTSDDFDDPLPDEFWLGEDA